MELRGGVPGSAHDEAFWHAVRALYEEAFPGLPAGIDRARAAGASWPEVSTPFAFFEGERCVAHVGVISHPMSFDGDEVRVAGIHAVCTTADRRRRGLCRELLKTALSWAETTHALAKLHTDLPAVYSGHGFRPVPTWRFRSAATPEANVKRRLLTPSSDPADAALLAAVLPRRAPVSHRCASADPGWMILIDAALGGLLDTAMWWLPDHEAIVVLGDDGEHTLVIEVIAAELPSAEIVAGAASDGDKPRFYTFAPERFEPDAAALRAPPALGTFMVRGKWPVKAPFGLSPLWEH